MKKVTFIAVMGTALEVYDFLIYSLLASYLAKIFFVGHSVFIIFIQTFIVFSAGYLSRPLGGVIIASIGDRFGRKKSFLLSIQIMAISTLLISLLPSYHTAGVISPILLMILRILQGMAHGAELPGAITFIVEFSKANKKGYNTGLIFFGAGLGGILSTTVVYLMTKFLNDSEIITFYWRIPFFIGGLLSLVGIYFRRHASETPLFENIEKKESSPFRAVLLNNSSLAYRGINIALLPTLLVILGHYLPAYFKEFQEFKGSDIYFSMLCGMLVFTASIPIFGLLSDFFDKKNLLLINTAITFIFSLYLLLNPIVSSALIFIFIYKLIFAAFFSCFPCVLADLFPVKIRYSGVAFCYNAAFVISALLLFLSTTLSKMFDTPKFTITLVITIATYSIFVMLFKSKKSVELELQQCQ